MQWLARVSVKRPVFASVLVLVTLVVGATGYFTLGVDRFPKVDLPTVIVSTRVPGGGAREIETEVSDKIEEAVNTLSGIDELRSVSAEGQSLVYVIFNLDKNGDVAVQEVRDHVNQVVNRLPVGTEIPVISKLDPDSTPILSLAVATKTERPIRDITEVADKIIRPRIENVAGVGEITIVGGRLRQINVIVDPVKLRAHSLTVLDVQRAIAGQNITMPGGSLKNGPRDVTLRVAGRVGSPVELGRLTLKNVAGHPVRVADVARVEDGAKEPDSAAVRNGQTAVLLSVRKQSGENTLAVVDAVRARVDEINPQLPASYRLEVVRDNSESIRTSVDAVKEHLVLGAIFAALVVLAFLGNLRSTIIAAIAIPISVIGTFALMAFEGFTLDNVTLLALALAVGIVIDDAIVVLENIFKHIHVGGEAPRVAAVEATQEIGLAVLATTLSLIAVFLPVAFMGGIVGRFLKSFGLTMAFSIAVSLLVSFTLTPMLASRWLKPLGDKKKPLLERVVDALYRPVERGYMAILRWVMRRRWVVVLASVGVLVAIVPLMRAVPKNFLPDNDEAQFAINMLAPEGTSLEETALIAERIARAARQMKEVASTLVTVGTGGQKTQNLASIYVKLVAPDARALSQAQIVDRTRREIVARQPKELQIDVSEVPIFSGGITWPVTYELTGPDLERLTAYGERALEALKAAPGAVDASTSSIPGKPEITVTIDREKAADLGVSVADIAAALRLLVGGVDVSSYLEQGNEYDIRVRAETGSRADAAGLGLVTVPSSRLEAVPLSEVVRLVPTTGPSQIDHSARRRQVMLYANVAPGFSEGAVSAALETAVQNMKLPPGYKLAAFGRSKETARAQRTFFAAFALSFIFMYLILAAQFESWLHPVTILLALPLTLPFALLSLLLLGQSLNVFSMLGVLVLFGVVKKNSILQIDHTNQLRAGGMARLDAVLAGNRDRLRPILMTTLAFVAGMIPLLFAHGIGAGNSRATAGGIVFGQILSLLLTLLATPVAYTLFDDAAAWLGRVVLRRTPEPEPERKVGAEVDEAVKASPKEHAA